MVRVVQPCEITSHQLSPNVIFPKGADSRYIACPIRALASIFFFLNDPPPTEFSPFSLPDAFPIYVYTIAPDRPFLGVLARSLLDKAAGDPLCLARMTVLLPTRRAARALRESFLRLSGEEGGARSEEHTSELQSQSNLVCRLLLEKK